MITTITEFKLPKPITLEEAKAIYLSTAPKYQNLDGLIRKCYLLSQDGNTVGGVYLWQSRAQAELLFNEDWRDFVRGKYNTEPTVTYFETPVVVDNQTNEIISND